MLCMVLLAVPGLDHLKAPLFMRFVFRYMVGSCLLTKKHACGLSLPAILVALFSL